MVACRPGGRAGISDGHGDAVDEVGRVKEVDFGPAFSLLAREELSSGRLEEAESVADLAPLGHCVFADALSSRGRAVEARAAAEKGRRLEAALRRNPPCT